MFRSTQLSMNGPRIVIIGAGAAGIAAASRLMKNGFHNLIILEAEDRIGGRIHTHKFGEGLVEMGAQWVHGEDKNIVYELASKYQLLNESSRMYTDTQFTMPGGKIIDSNIVEHLQVVLARINEDSDKDFPTSEGNVGQYFTERFFQAVIEENHSISSELAKAFLDWYHKFQNSIDGSDTWFDTSAQGTMEYWECAGNPLLSWNQGYCTLFDLLMDKYPDPEKQLPIESKIIFNKEVCRILWDKKNDNVCTVACKDDTSYVADYVLSAVSLGVLKKNAETLFVPELPNPNLTAIRGLAFGTVDKIYIRFPYRWWPEDCSGFSLLWNDAVGDSEKHENVLEQVFDDWTKDIFGFYTLFNHPKVLCGWVSGPSARIMEQLTESEVLEGCMTILKYFVGSRCGIPQPEEIVRSTWHTNPHFCGSYSFISMDTKRNKTSASDLARPVSNSKGKQVLFFAGEATHDHYYSTVHGAVESGYREADRITKLHGCEIDSRSKL